MFTALLHNGALLCSQISQVFAVFAPRHVDPSSVSPIHRRLYLRSAPLLLSLRLTKCCGASTAGRLRVCYITAAPASPNRCRARASLSLATYLASASLFKARQLRFFFSMRALLGFTAFLHFLFSTHTNGSPRAAATQKPPPPVSVTLLQTRSPSGGALRDCFVSPDHYLYMFADDVITQISTKKDGTLYHQGRPGLHF